MIVTKLTGMQSNLLAAANRLSGVDGGPNAPQQGFRYLAIVRPAALIRRLHISFFFLFHFFLLARLVSRLSKIHVSINLHLLIRLV